AQGVAEREIRRHRTKSGGEIDVELRASEIRLAGKRVGLVTAFDVTERTRAEEALRESDRRKNEFLAVLAHELRGPLSPISNALEIVRRARLGQDGPDRDSRPVASAVDMLDRQVRQMVRLIDDLLDVGRISSGKME